MKPVRKSAIPPKVKRVQLALDRLERGAWSEFTIDQCCDYIGWLTRFKKVPEEVWGPMCEQATRILEGGETA